jgi:hypothetical protein
MANILSAIRRYSMVPIALLAAGMTATSASANSPMPTGLWVLGAGSFYISPSGCKFETPVGVTVGPCSWNGTSRGGILTVMHSSGYKPYPIYFNVLWINRGKISIQGEVYRRRN